MKFKEYCESYFKFWSKYPAFFIGLFLFIGIAFSFEKKILLIFIAFLFGFPFFLKKNKESFLKTRKVLAIAYTASGFFYGLSLQPYYSSDDESVEGRLYFQPKTLKVHEGPFFSSLAVSGTGHYFIGTYQEEGSKLPVQIFLPQDFKKRPFFNADYIIEGSLIKKSSYQYLFKPTKDAPWKKVDNTSRFTEWRFNAKQKVESYLIKKFTHKKTRAFLNALLTGDIHERLLSFEFSRIGLQHILAISGFHFGILFSVFGFVLKKVLPEKLAFSTLIILFAAYVFFLGESPSVIRSFIAIFLLLSSYIFRLQNYALNALGVGLSFELLLNPLSIYNPGFQFSFLATLSILLLYRPVYQLMCLILPERTKEEKQALVLSNRLIYYATSCLRPALTLNLAVNIVTLPICLYHFHYFPLLSLIYNLFFPFWTSAMIFLFLLGCFIDFLIPTFSSCFFSFIDQSIFFALKVASSPPLLLDYSLSVKNCSLSFIYLYLMFFLLLGIYLESKKKEQMFTI